MNRQSTFTDYGASEPRRHGPKLSQIAYSTGIDYGLIYPEPSLDDDSCPWCLAPPAEFKDQLEEHPGEVACTFCQSVIPVHMDWYQRGEKIVI